MPLQLSNHYGCSSPYFSGYPRWGDSITTTQPLPSRGPYDAAKSMWLQYPRNKCALGLRVKTSLKRCRERCVPSQVIRVKSDFESLPHASTFLAVG